MSPSRPWRGCHGVRLLGGDDLDLSEADGEPILEATVREGAVAAPQGDELWRLAEEVSTPDGPATAEQRLWRQDDGTLVLHTNRGAALAVDQAARHLTVAGPDPGIRSQLVAAYGVPLVLHGGPCIVLHGSACAFNGQAVVVVGQSGVGKSSVMVRLLDAGWTPLTEDLSSVDLRGAPAVWPGPPWVRRLRGEPGPATASVRFTTADKVVWDIAPWQSRAPLPIARIVVLGEPGGPSISTAPLTPGEAIGELAEHAVWLTEAAAGPAALFSPVASLAASVGVLRLRLPRTGSWLDAVPPLFEEIRTGLA